MSASIFISFASQDLKVAFTICKALESRGFKCWISSRDILPGENFQVAIVRAIRNARMMLLVFTGNSNNSEEMTKELVLASQNKLIVVPLRIEDVTPNEAFSYEFATRQWIDFFSDWEAAMNQLSERIASALGPEAGGRAEPAAAVLEAAPARAGAAGDRAVEPPPPKPAEALAPEPKPERKPEPKPEPEKPAVAAEVDAGKTVFMPAGAPPEPPPLARKEPPAAPTTAGDKTVFLPAEAKAAPPPAGAETKKPRNEAAWAAVFQPGEQPKAEPAAAPQPAKAPAKPPPAAKAPAAKPAPASAAAPRKGAPVGLIIGIGVVVLALAGGAYYATTLLGQKPATPAPAAVSPHVAAPPPAPAAPLAAAPLATTSPPTLAPPPAAGAPAAGEAANMASPTNALAANGEATHRKRATSTTTHAVAAPTSHSQDVPF